MSYIYIKPDHIIGIGIISRYLENSTKNMIPTHRTFYLMDKMT